MRAKAATTTGWVRASVPPAIARSTTPVATSRAASPMAAAPDEQAWDTVVAMPVTPSFIDSQPAVALGMIIGTVSGLTRMKPFSWPTSSAVRKGRIIPPRPVPTTMAVRSPPVSSHPASTTASIAAQMPSWVVRSVRRVSGWVRWVLGSKASSTSQATRTGPKRSSSIASRRWA